MEMLVCWLHLQFFASLWQQNLFVLVLFLQILLLEVLAVSQILLEQLELSQLRQLQEVLAQERVQLLEKLVPLDHLEVLTLLKLLLLHLEIVLLLLLGVMLLERLLDLLDESLFGQLVLLHLLKESGVTEETGLRDRFRDLKDWLLNNRLRG